MRERKVKTFLAVGILFLMMVSLSGLAFADQAVSRSTAEDIDPLQSGINLLLSSFVEKAHKVEDVDIEADTSLALMKLDGQVGITRQYLPLQNGVWLNRLRFNKTFTSGMTLWGNMQNLDNSSRHLDMDFQEGPDFMVNFYYDRMTHWVNPKMAQLSQGGSTTAGGVHNISNSATGVGDQIVAATAFQAAGFFDNTPVTPAAAARFLDQSAWDALRFSSDFHKSRDEFFLQGRGRVTENFRLFGNAGLKQDTGTREGYLWTTYTGGAGNQPHPNASQKTSHIHLLHIPVDWNLSQYLAGFDYVSEKAGVKGYYTQDSFHHRGYYFQDPAFLAEARNVIGQIPAAWDLNRYPDSDGSKARLSFNVPVLDTVSVAGGWESSRARELTHGRTNNTDIWDLSATIGPYHDFSVILYYDEMENKYNFIESGSSGLFDGAALYGTFFSAANSQKDSDRKFGATVNWTGNKDFSATFSFQDRSIDRSKLYWTGMRNNFGRPGFYNLGYLGGIVGTLNVLVPGNFDQNVYPQWDSIVRTAPVFLPLTTNEETRTYSFRGDWRPDRNYYFTGRFRKIDGDIPYQRTVATEGTDWNLMGTFNFNPNLSLVLNYDSKDRDNKDSGFFSSERNYGATINAHFLDRFNFTGNYSRQDADATYDLLFIFTPQALPFTFTEIDGTLWGGGGTGAPFSTNGVILSPSGRTLHYRINNDNWLSRINYQASNTLGIWGDFGINQSSWNDLRMTPNPDPAYAGANTINDNRIGGNYTGVNFRQTTYGIGCDLRFKNAEKRVGFAWQHVDLQDLNGERALYIFKNAAVASTTIPAPVQGIRQSYSGKVDLFTATYTQKF